ncbi:MAG TPA: DNA polymerase III subunit delta [Beijerinckiaceae bacterium]|nr:DNA polymerase III subunit delta [Beijerinckiaceae bacterium]
MTAIKSGDLARFMAGGWQTCPVVLVFGPDEGAVREIAGQLVRAAAGADPDPLNCIRLDGETLAQDPARLADEARTFGLFGGRRVVHVRNAARTPAASVTAIADDPVPDTLVILEAVDLKSGAPLRTLAEKHRSIAAIACYADGHRSLQTLIETTLSGHGLSLTRDGRDALMGALGADRLLTRSELDKLTLYALGEKTVDARMVAEIVSDAGRHETSSLIDFAFAGHLATVEPEANRIFATGIHPASLMTQVLSHIMLMRRLRRAVDRGQSLDALLRQARLHFSRVPAVEAALRSWNCERLDRALVLASDAVLNSRRTARLADSLAIRLLWSIARMAGKDKVSSRIQ